MSVHFSKFALNTYSMFPYFLDQIPDGYPLSLVLQKCRAFRKLPPHVRELAALAKQWAIRKYPENPAGINAIELWYDNAGNELDRDTGHRLTNQEIDAEWQPDPSLASFTVTDIPIPAGGFADPATWGVPPAPPETKDRPTKARLMSDISSRGRQAVADTYGLPESQLPYTGSSRDETDYETAKADFASRLDDVLASKYFSARPNKLQVLMSALDNVDIYDDLSGQALDVFERAEAYID